MPARAPRGSQPLPPVLPRALGPYLAAEVREQWGAYRRRLRRCRKKFSPRNVHDLRVESRRLIAQLQLIGQLPEGPDTENVWRRLKRRFQRLGEVRDVQVQVAFVQRKLGRFPQVAPFLRELQRQERAQRKTAAELVQRFKMGKLGWRLEKVQAKLNRHGQDQRYQAKVARAGWRAAQQAFDAARRRQRALDPAQVQTVHRFRLAYKRFRYMAECLPPWLGGATRRRRAAMVLFQRQLGSVHDVDVLLARLDQYVDRHRKQEKNVATFRLDLLRRRARLVRGCLAGGRKLRSFWPRRRLVSSPVWQRR